MNVKNKKRWLAVVFGLLLMLVQIVVSTEPVQAQQSTIVTYAAYQEFENGFMIWREDTGEIYAFSYSPATVYRFAEATYEDLPENPVTEQAPHGFVKPIRGFGRVWGNHSYVRNRLGWGLNSEFGYSATVVSWSSYGNGEQISKPDGSWVRYFSDNSWSDASAVVPPTVLPTPGPFPGPMTYTTGATFQEFERGTMIYAGDSGTIWVLLHSGEAYTYRTYDYGMLPYNPVWDWPPPGYVSPIMGFGKVWGNFTSVRNGLGWAVTHEAGYQMQISHDANYSWVLLRLPSGEWIQIATSGTWYYR